MGTYYSGFHPPITSIRVHEGTTHDRISVFENHMLVDVLSVSAGHGRAIARLFAGVVDVESASSVASTTRGEYGGEP